MGLANIRRHDVGSPASAHVPASESNNDMPKFAKDSEVIHLFWVAIPGPGAVLETKAGWKHT